MLNVIISGAPGSGKGTQGDLIAAKYNLKHLSTGELLRKEIDANTETGKIADSYISKGNLVPDEMIIEILSNIIDSSNKTHNGFIFDGFPRTVAQAEALDTLFKEKGFNVDLMLDIDVEERELINRILKRGEISGRSDDNIDTIKRRLAVYHEKTEPVSSFYKHQKKHVPVNGMGSVMDIHERITDIIDSFYSKKQK